MKPVSLLGTLLSLAVLSLNPQPSIAQQPQTSSPPASTPQQQALSAYFDQQVHSLEGQLERDIKTKDDWAANKNGIPPPPPPPATVQPDPPACGDARPRSHAVAHRSQSHQDR